MALSLVCSFQGRRRQDGSARSSRVGGDRLAGAGGCTRCTHLNFVIPMPLHALLVVQVDVSLLEIRFLIPFQRGRAGGSGHLHRASAVAGCHGHTTHPALCTFAPDTSAWVLLLSAQIVRRVDLADRHIVKLHQILLDVDLGHLWGDMEDHNRTLEPCARLEVG